MESMEVVKEKGKRISWAEQYRAMIERKKNQSQGKKETLGRCQCGKASFYLKIVNHNIIRFCHNCGAQKNLG